MYQYFLAPLFICMGCEQNGKYSDLRKFGLHQNMGCNIDRIIWQLNEKTHATSAFQYW